MAAPRSSDESPVLLVSHYYPPHLGGVENVVRNQAERLAARGRPVAVLTSSCGGAVGSGHAAGVRVTRVRAWNGAERAWGVPFPVFGPALLLAAWREVRRAALAHLHEVQYPSSWAAALACRLTGTPYLVTQHVDLVEHPSAVVRLGQRLVHRVLGGPVLRRARAVFVVNDRVRDFVIEAGVAPDDVQVLANGVDTDQFHPGAGAGRALRRAGRRWSPQDVVVLFVGRPVPKKGFDVLQQATDAAYRVAVAGPPATGPTHPDVELLGPLPPGRLAELYQDADVFVLPSRSEGFPLTVQEAMASGLPVVTTDDPAYAGYGLDRELVRLVDPTPGSVRAALRELAGSPALRRAMGRYSRSVAVDRFSWPVHLDVVDGTYRRILADRP
jgi:D-inositol-3-phosphate glycosyltransferase